VVPGDSGDAAGRRTTTSPIQGVTVTFSLAARCARTGQFGVAIASSSPAVASRCAHVRAGVGAVCTQNVTDPRLGPKLLDQLVEGSGARVALHRVVSGETAGGLAAVDGRGRRRRARRVLGRQGVGNHAQAIGTDAVAAGNMLAGEAVCGRW